MNLVNHVQQANTAQNEAVDNTKANALNLQMFF